MNEEIKKEETAKVFKIQDHRLLTAKLNVYDWMSDVAVDNDMYEIIEVRFKNTRKGFYHNHAGLTLQAGDVVAVEASPGHDIGIVSLTGELVKEHMKKYNLRKDTEFKKVYRKAKPHDIEKWEDAISLEHQTMIKSRKLSEELNLNMKIGDVEYQGDKTKAIFYYIAEERVDFRQLIKVLAETFRIRIEMKQIGARQEAGRIGGIGPCGRELCCSSFITNFVSVTTAAARYQDISLNPQKLAGQCSKLKCCLNYEVDAYVDAQKEFPSSHIDLKTEGGNLRYAKSDIFGRTMTYTLHKDGIDKFICLPLERVKFIQAENRKGKIVERALEEEKVVEKKSDYENVVGQDSLHRFDDAAPRKTKNKRNIRNKKRFNKGNKEAAAEKSADKVVVEKAANTVKPVKTPNNKQNNKPNNGNKPANKPKANKVVNPNKTENPNKQNKPKRTININKAGTESNPDNANKPAPTAKPNKPKPRNNRPKKNNTVKKDIKPKE
jgi:cell fate regulator YaaT (PSP1 superfamily)